MAGLEDFTVLNPQVPYTNPPNDFASIGLDAVKPAAPGQIPPVVDYSAGGLPGSKPAVTPDGTPIPPEVMAAAQSGKPFTATLQPGATAADVKLGEPAAAPAAPAPAAPALKWEQVTNSPKFKELPSDRQEQIRNQYFYDFVAPKVPAGRLEEFKSAFDRDTKPTVLGKIWNAAKEAGTAISNSVETSRLDSPFYTGAKDKVSTAYSKLSEARRAEIAARINPERATPSQLAFLDLHNASRTLLAESALKSPEFMGPARPGPTVQAALERIATPANIEQARREVKEGAARVDALPEKGSYHESLMRGFGNMAQSGVGKRIDANARLLSTADRIDAGERVADQDDPVGYQYMSPAQRAQFRKERETSQADAFRDLGTHLKTIQDIPQPESVKRYTSAKSYAEAWETFTRDPVSIIAHLGMESAPASIQMMMGATAGSLVAGPAGAIYGSGLASASAEYGGAIIDGLTEAGIDVTNPAALKTAVKNPELMRVVREAAAAKAAAVGAFDAASMGVAGKTLAPAKMVIGAPTRAEAVNIAAQAPVQAGLGAGGAAMGNAMAGKEQNPGEVAAEAAGEFATAPLDVLGMALFRRKISTKRAGKNVSPPSAGNPANSSTGAASQPQMPGEAQPAESPANKQTPVGLSEISSTGAAPGAKEAGNPRQSSTLENENEPVDASTVLDTVASTEESLTSYQPNAPIDAEFVQETPPGQQPAYAGPDRRADAAERKRIADMSPEEMRRELNTDHLTGLPSRRAYEESERLPVVATVDVDSFKTEINDTYGHKAGDQVLVAVADAFRAATAPMARTGGDEFTGDYNTPEEAAQALDAAREHLGARKFTFDLPDGTQTVITGVGFSYGIGKDIAEADAALYADKAEREKAGLRRPRPSEFAEGNAGSAEGQQTGEGGVDAQTAPGKTEQAPETQTSPEGNAGSEIAQGADATGNVPDTVRGAEPSASSENPTDAPVTPSPAQSGDVLLGHFGLVPPRAKDKNDATSDHALRLKKTDAGYALFQGKNEAIDGESGNPIVYASVDEAVADLRAELKKKEGRRFLSNKQAIYFADEFKGKKGDAKKKPDDRKAMLEDHFAPGNIIKSDYWNTHDKVLAFNWNDGSWSVDVQEVKKVGDEWQPAGQKRNHATMPSAKDVVVERAATAPPPATPIAPTPAQTAQTSKESDSKGATPADGQPATPIAADEKPAGPTAAEMQALKDKGNTEKAAAKAAKEAEKAKAKARKLAERNLFTSAVADPDVIKAAGTMDADAFAAKSNDLFAAMIADMASAAAGDVAYVDALKGMVQDGKIVMPREFMDSVYKQAKKAADAANEKAKVSKEHSTGESLRRHWEQLAKGVNSASAADMAKAWAQILKATARADFFPILLADDATPGAKEWLPKFRDQIATFQEFYVREMINQSHSSKKGRFYHGSSAENVFMGKYSSDRGRLGKLENVRRDSTDEQRLELTKIIAQEYQQHVQKLANQFEGLKTLADIKEVIERNYGTPGDYKMGSMDAGDVALYYDNSSRFPHLLPDKPGGWDYKYGIWNKLELTENIARPEGERKDALIRTRLDKIVRSGLVDQREGRNISSAEFKKTFGFADVTIGEYVTAKESVDHLNYSYDALMTLAGLLGAKPSQLGFGGKLHFSIGALGHGKYAAHFSPNHPTKSGGTVPVINVTNTKGDGAVLHEYFHAIDSLASDEKLKRAIAGVKRMLQQTPPKPSRALEIARRFFSGSRWTRMPKNSTPLDHAEYALGSAYAGDRAAERTTFYNNAVKLDAGNTTKPYWSNDKEPFARMAEAWGLDTLTAKNQRDDYLQSDWAADGKTVPPKYRGTPYPLAAERADLVKVFQSLVNNIEWTDTGPVLKADSPWQESSPWAQAMSAFHEERKRVLANLDDYYKQYQQEQADKKAQAEKDKEEAIFGQKDEAPADEPAADEPSTDEATAENPDDMDLDAIFEEVAKGKREAQQETEPGTPEPGETIQQPLSDTFTFDDLNVLRDRIAAGENWLMGGDYGKPFGIPSIHDMPSADTKHMGFGMFTTSTADYEANWDGGGAMPHLPSGIPYTSVSVSRGTFPYPRARILDALDAKINVIKAAALMSGRGGKIPSSPSEKWDAMGYGPRQDLAMSTTYASQRAVVHRISGSKWAQLSPGEQEEMARAMALTQKKPPTATPTLDEVVDKTAAQLAAEMAKHGITGIDEALKGLTKLFGSGPGKLQSFPGGFDEEVYRQAKPHFLKSAESFKKAGMSFGEFVRKFFDAMIDAFGEGFQPYAVRFAKEYRAQYDAPPATEPEIETPASSPSARLANWMLDRLESETQTSWTELFAQADKDFGGTQAAGTYNPKDAYDAVELAVNLWISRNRPMPAAVADMQARVDELEKMLSLTPTQTKRTQEMDEWQQFSTPPHFSAVANWVANLKSTDVYLEPSAGIGGLAIFGKLAKVKQVIVNEFNARRAAIIRALPFDQFYNEDALQLNNILPDSVKPTVIVMNPPFSATGGRKEGERDTMNGAKHIEQALKRLAPGGRLVAIVGEGMGADRPAFRAWWEKIGKEYNVRANVGVSGESYVKYGTTFDNQLLVIDKDGPTVGKILTGKVEHPRDAIPLLEVIRDSRPARTESEATTGVDSNAPGQPPSGTPATADQGGKNGTAGTSGSSGGRGGGKSSAKSGSNAGTPAANGDGGQSASGGARTDSGGQSDPGSARGTQPGGNEGAGNSGDAQSSDIKLGEAIEGADKGAIGNSVFEQYAPKKVNIPGAIPHNTPLVESAALASVVPPAPTYTPNLPKEVVTEGKLSSAQLEAVVYAGQAHEQMLRDETTRRGFFLGDGTGVGKGRQISGIILDNMRQGRKKAVWISKKKELIEDAKRDFGDIGGNPGIIFNYAKQKADKPITEKDGILFAGYPTLRSESQTAKLNKKAAKEAAKKGGGAPKQDGPTYERIKHMVNWLGEGFDGVIVFDESHEMGNAVAIRGARGMKEPSQQALAALELQRALPNARVVYVSATGATEVSNLAYAERLGLWGDGTPFSNVTAFASEMSKSVSAMELVAQNLKQMGLYLARSLSYNGVKYAKLQHELTSYQRDTYDTLATAWQNVLNNIDAALEDCNATEGKDAGKIKGAILSMFWGSHQRFFNQILTAAQMPSVLAQIEQDLKAGNAVVLQLTSTNEADQNRALAKLAGQQAEKRDAGEEPDDDAFEEMDLTPRDQLITMLEKAFPTQQYEEYTDEDGNTRLRPVIDANGKAVQNKDAIAKRDALIAEVRNMEIPDAALPMLINHFGADKVAEITGRTQRVVRGDDGKMKVQRLSPAHVQADANDFKNDKKQILIFSQAGGTGFSFQSDIRYKNQRPRVHYILQPGWSADKVIQGLGRTHRTNQKSAPMYRLVSTDAPAQKRFISSVARRIEQLGALTGGQRDSAGGGSVFSASDNLESAYATAAVRQFFVSVTGQSRPPGVPDDLLRQLGLGKVVDENGRLNETGIPPVTQFLNRLLSLRLETQEVVFDLFMQQVDSQIEFAKRNGTFDDGLATIEHVGATVKMEQPVYTDPQTKAVTKYVEIDYKVNNAIYPFDRAAKEVAAAKQGAFFTNNHSGRVAGILSTNLTRTDKDGRIHALYAYWRTSGRTYEVVSDFKKDAWTRITPDEAKPLWEKENAERPKTINRKLHMVVGGILPLWSRFNNNHIQVARIGTDDGRRFLGRQISEKDLEPTLQKLDVESSAAKMTGADIIDALKEGKTVEMSNGMMFKQVRVSGQNRVELLRGNNWLDATQERRIKNAGLFIERIEYKERFFAPNAEAIDNVMTSLAMNPFRVISNDAKLSTGQLTEKPFYANLPRNYQKDTQGDAERLRREASRILGKELPAGSIRVVALPDDAYLQKIASAVGKRVVGFESTSALLKVNGATFPGGDVIYINIDATRPHLAVLGHELGHQLKKEAPAVYLKLVNFIREQVNQRKYGQFAADYKGYTEEEVREEFIGEVFSDGFMNRGFWYSLASHNQNLYDAVVNAIQKLWAKVKEALKPYTPKTDKYLRDYAAVMRMAGEAMAEYQASKKGKPGPAKFNTEPGKFWKNVAMKFQTAWHGTPHDFDQFTTEKMGTGEGAQAYGWGMYFGGRREVAEHYRNILAYPLFDGERITSARIEEVRSNGDQLMVDALSAVLMYGSYDAAVAKLKADAIYWRNKPEVVIAKLQSVKSRFANEGRLYEVELAPKEDDYLDWDKPLKNQSAHVKAMLAKAGIVNSTFRTEPMYNAKGAQIGFAAFKNDETAASGTGESADEAIKKAKQLQDAKTGRDIYFGLMNAGPGERVGRGQEGASKLLKSIGIPGIRFLDGSSRKKGEGHHNYVIFDEKDVKITAKFSQSDRTDQTESPAFKKWFGNSAVVDSNGKPLVVYHGTRRDFSAFEEDKIRRKLPDNGFYFTDSQRDASDFATGSGLTPAGGNVRPSYLSLKNPAFHDFKGEQFKSMSLFDVVEKARAEGRDGVIVTNILNFKNGQTSTTYIVFRPEQIKSAIGNNGDFDGTNPDIRFNQMDAPKESRRGLLDNTLRLAGGQLVADWITKPAYNWLIETGSKLIPEGIKAGVVDKYGLAPAYLTKRNEMYVGQARGAIQARSVVDELTLLDRQQSRIAYLWMTQKDEEAGNILLDKLSADAQVLLKAIKQQIHEMGEEAVLLKQLTQEAFDRHDMAYLHRTYEKHEVESPQDKARRQRAIQLLGEQYKGRGMVDWVTNSSLRGRLDSEGKPIDIKGRMFTRLELRKGKRLFGMVYWPTGEAIPDQYKDWKHAGDWEARYFNKAGKVGLWRDFTPDERQKMGEIDEIKYALAKTLNLMTHDIEVGRFFKWIADEYAETSPEGLNVVNASERLTKGYKKDEWVHVPVSNIQGTSVPVYGALAGLYVPGPIWNDIRQVAQAKYQPFGEVFDATLRAWKLSKTAFSPATHMNNIMGNFIFADMNDVGARDLYKAARTMLGDTPEAKALKERFEVSGAQLGSFVSKEIKRETLQNLLKELRQDMDQAGIGASIRMADIVSRVFQKDFRGAASGIADTKLGRLTAATANKAMDAYQMEDSIFRFAAFLKAIDDGYTDIEAGRIAREDFLDYNITAPWINAARSTALPFIAFTYRAIPMILRTLAEKPWKLFKYMTVFAAFDALSYALLGLSGDDEDKERALLPDEKSGKLWGVVPKLLRMPWNDPHSSPVFLDVRRWIPVGDIVDFGQNHSAVPIPPMLMPGGPMWLIAEILADRSAFTGKNIVLDTDTTTEKIMKSLGHLYKGAAPNLPVLPGTYSFTAISNAAKGKTDVFGREQSVGQAVLSSIGIKLGAYPRDVLLRNEKLDFEARDRELQMQTRGVVRQHARKGIDREEMREQLERLRTKRVEEHKKFRDKLSGK